MKKGFGTVALEKGKGSKKSRKIVHLQPPLYLLMGTRVTDGGGRMESGGGAFVFLTMHF